MSRFHKSSNAYELREVRMISRWLLALVALAMVACGSSTTSPSSSAGGSSGSSSGGNNRGTISATIDGKAWNGTISVATASFGSLAIAATDSSGLMLGFGAPASVGTTSVGIASPTDGTVQEAGKGWHAGLRDGSGTVTVASITSTRATGTFSFTMVPLPNTGSSGNRVVTNGKFDVNF
jgi:hypothetical protein